MPRRPPTLLPEATTTHTLAVDRWRPPSLNRSIRSHWAVRARAIRRAADLLAVEAIRQGVPKAEGKRRVSLRITLSGRQRKYDDDNAWKLMLDAMVKCGLLVDDSAAWVERGGPVAFDRGAATRTEITLEELG